MRVQNAGLFPVVGYAGGREPRQLEREQKDGPDSKNETGRGYPEEAQESEELVDPRVLFDRGKNTQSGSQQYAKQKRARGELERCWQSL